MIRQAIIVAGGNGTRMKTEIPKQFLSLCGKPIVMHTLETFHRFDHQIVLIVVLPEELISSWETLSVVFHFKIPHISVSGGKSVSESFSLPACVAME